MSKVKILIGIDPDTEKSGFAFLDKTASDLQLRNLTFFELFDKLKEVKENCFEHYFDVQVYIECGFLNGGNRHKVSEGSLSLNSKIGERIGANHEVAKKICEMCEHLGLNHTKVRPTKSKANSDFFKQITGYNKKTNQEQRDACLLIWGL
jgi:deoxyribose-phosphate aldolase